MRVALNLIKNFAIVETKWCFSNFELKLVGKHYLVGPVKIVFYRGLYEAPNRDKELN